MKYNQLGKTGVLVSELCLGTMTFGGKGYWKAMGEVPQDEVTQILNSVNIKLTDEELKELNQVSEISSEYPE